MKRLIKLHDMSENTFYNLFFAYISACFLIAAVFMPDRSDMLAGFLRILGSPTKLSSNFFVVGGYAGTFLNMGLVGVASTFLHCLPGKDKNNAAALLVHILTIGFAA